MTTRFSMLRELGRYRLIERIASGGMGEVYRGVDVGWGGVERPVAVKLIAPELARYPDFVATFIDEAKLSFLLCHRNVVQVRDIGLADDTYFIAMEWVDGADLGTLIKKMASGPRQPLPMRFAVAIAAEAARGLDYAHRATDVSGAPLHLVHRDVSPTNLLVSYEGEVKVTDFGIARWRMKQTVSMPGALKGKVGYMAPEQARGEEVDARADVWALGVVLYEMLTGRNPFLGGTDVETLTRLRAGSYPSPSTVHALPAALEAIVLRAMAPSRGDRYATCAALCEDLEAYARRESYLLSATHLGQFVRGVLTDGTATTEPQATVLRARTPSAPRPFDAALGAQLAALQSGEPEESEVLTRTTLPGKRSVAAPTEAPKRTVAMLQPVSAMPIVERPPTTDLTSLIPRRRTGRIVAGVVVGVLLVGGATLIAVRAGSPARPPTIPVVADVHVPPPPAAPVAQQPRPPAPGAVASAPPQREHRVARAPLHAQPAVLEVETVAEGQVTVDQRFRGNGPLVSVELPPGAHQIRVEATLHGLRTVPRDETVELKAGEHRHLKLEPQ
jgi:serine/threonine-protein kinase